MFATMTPAAAIAAVALLAPVAAAQHGDSLSLEQKLRIALANNPEIQLAQARVRQAEAELQAMRLKVTQQVLELHASYTRQQQLVAMAQRAMDRIDALVKNGAVSTEDTHEAQRTLVDAQTQFARLEAQARYVLGSQSDGGDAPTLPEGKPARPTRPPVSEEFAGHLEVMVDLEVEDAPIADVIASFAAIVADEQLVTRPMKFVIDQASLESELGALDDIRVTAEQGKIALGDALLILADRMPVRFVMRDYGVLVTTESRAITMSGATIPKDVPYAVYD